MAAITRRCPRPGKNSTAQRQEKGEGGVNREDSIALAKVRLEELLTFFGINTRVQVDDADERVELLVETEGSGHLIGHHGENLRALQYLLNMMLRGRSDEALRVSVDIGGYKKSRAEAVEARAREQ